MLPRFRKAKAPSAGPPDEPDEATPRREGRAANAWRRFRRSTNRYRLLTDVLGALVLVGLVVGGISSITGGTWPPLVIVESGSMMHAYQETSYGRVGTIDVGDMVFVRGVKDHHDIETWAEGGRDRYNRPGHVLAFVPNGDRSNISVIHRAIAFVNVSLDERGGFRYEMHWVDGEIKRWGNSGIYFPPLGFDENWGFSPTNGFRPSYSGFITKGDNGFSNPASDQAMGITRLVDPTWIVGTVYGEVPWIGLAKLALQTGQTNPAVPGWERVGNAFAPLELWTMFFVTIAVIVLIPLTLDTIRAWRAIRRERAAALRMEEENRKRAEARRAAERATKRVATFATVVSSRPAPRPPPRDPGRGTGGDGRPGRSP